MYEGRFAIMNKKILSVILAFVCLAAVLPAVTAAEQPVVMEAATKKTPSITKVYSAVKKAYGENYLPNVRLSKDEIKARYGISKSWYKGAIAEVPMISTQADELVIVKAKNANAKKKIKRALLDYQKMLKEDTCQYPMNQLKIQASKVYVKGSYVCFFILGSIDNETEKQGEDKVIAAYKAENSKAVAAIKKLYK